MSSLEDRIKEYVPTPGIPGFTGIAKSFMPRKRWKVRKNRLRMQAESRRKNRR
jgi:hypothetical protein